MLTIFEQIQIIMIIIVTACIVVVFQVAALWRVFRSRSWLLSMLAFIVFASIEVWRFVRLSGAIMRAQAKDALPATLTFEQWVNVGLLFLFFGLIMVSYDKLRRDMRRMGI